MPGIFVLGPSKWLDPENVISSLPDTPLESREAIVTLAGKFDAHAFLMEQEQIKDGETHSGLFRRLVRDRDVQAFLILLPAGAQLHGLEKEFGAILEWLEQGWLNGDQVYILAEKLLYEESGDGDMGALSEPGNRTRYHDDFVTCDVRIRLWDDPASLAAHAINVFTEAKVANHGPWHEPLHA